MGAASVLVITSLLTTLGYATWIRVKPFKTCRRCHGYGRTPTRTGRGRPKTCRRCDGHGIRPRACRRPARAAARLLADAKSEAKR